MKQTASDATVVLYPPKIELTSQTDKYNLVLRLTWGEFERIIKVSREDFGFYHKLTSGLNDALLEGSESNPYLIK